MENEIKIFFFKPFLKCNEDKEFAHMDANISLIFCTLFLLFDCLVSVYMFYFLKYTWDIMHVNIFFRYKQRWPTGAHFVSKQFTLKHTS